ncbi:MAG: choice-of-anchor P family protein, partial [Panacagrimonas sp.]
TDGDSNADAASTAAKAAGIEVFAIGFNISTSQEQTIRMQVSPPPDDHFFSTTDEQSLNNAFDAIGGSLSSPLIAFSRGIGLRGTGLLSLNGSGLLEIARRDFLINDQNPDNNIPGGSVRTIPVDLPLGPLTVTLGVINASATGGVDDATGTISATGQASLASIDIAFDGGAVLSIGAVDARADTIANNDVGFLAQGDIGTDVAELRLTPGSVPIELLPNTPITIPGVAEVVIEERIPVAGDNFAGITVNGV